MESCCAVIIRATVSNADIERPIVGVQSASRFMLRRDELQMTKECRKKRDIPLGFNGMSLWGGTRAEGRGERAGAPRSGVTIRLGRVWTTGWGRQAPGGRVSFPRREPWGLAAQGTN